MKKEEFTISIYMEDNEGILTRILTIFNRRKIKIESLNVSPSEAQGIRRFTIIVNESEDLVKKTTKQIQKQIEVIRVYFNKNKDVLWQELMLYKIPSDIVLEEQYIEKIFRKCRADIVYMNKDFTVFSVTGKFEEVNSFMKKLKPYGLVEFAQSGRVAIPKHGEGFHKKLNEIELK